jgi:hypothetical protein
LDRSEEGIGNDVEGRGTITVLDGGAEKNHEEP